MDLRVSVVLLFFFLTGGYSLRCYTCEPDFMGYCDTWRVETCPNKFSACVSVMDRYDGYYKEYGIMKGCVPDCVTPPEIFMKASIHCCNTDLCNAADGVFKGSFLLLFSPLLFYFLFQ